MVIVLVAMVVMLGAVVAMFRNTGSGLSIAGNMGFKQDATSVADLGVETARNWLSAQSAATLSASAAVSGYYETWAAGFNPLTYNWAQSVTLPADAQGNTVQYVIHRMCGLTGLTSVAGQQCVYPSTAQDGSRQLGGAGASLTPPITPLYRITVRVQGPRNTMSYTQAMVY